MAIQRLFVTKTRIFQPRSTTHVTYLTNRNYLCVPVTGVTIYERYDIENLDEKDLEAAKNLIFSGTSCGYSIRRNSSFARFRICC